MVYGSGFMIYGLWFMGLGLSFMVYDLWVMVYSSSFMVYWLWFMVQSLGTKTACCHGVPFKTRSGAGFHF
jgi:hypothetical protein